MVNGGFRGLNWLIEHLGSIEQALDWSFRHQNHSHYGDSPMFRDLHTPDLEPELEREPIECMEEFGPDDYRTVSGQALIDVRDKVGKNWPIIRLAFDSLNANERLGAAITVKGLFAGYPENYLLATLLLWRVTGRIRQSILLSLSGTDSETEINWRERITGQLDESLDKTLDNLRKIN